MNSNYMLKIVGGEVAVQAFFMISGYYMALVVNNYSSKKDFWISRYLRLYPTYLVCGILTVLLMVKTQQFEKYYQVLKNLPLEATIFTITTNASIFFQDFVMLLGVQNNSLVFVKHFSESTPPLHELLILPQGWSLGIELSFYLIAPFILSKPNKFIYLSMLFSLAIRALLIQQGYFSDPWSYRFFPSEIFTFLLGSLAYKHRTVFMDLTTNRVAQTILCGSMLCASLCFQFLPIQFHLKKICFLALLFISMNPIFELSKNSYFDREVGSLSYPIYLGHFIVFTVLQRIHNTYQNASVSNTLITYTCVVAFAIGVHLCVEVPIEGIRKKIKIRTKSFKSIH